MYVFMYVCKGIPTDGRPPCMIIRGESEEGKGIINWLDGDISWPKSLDLNSGHYDVKKNTVAEELHWFWSSGKNGNKK